MRETSICFIGTFRAEQVQFALDAYYVCTFIESAKITDDLLHQYSYVFVKSDHVSNMPFYCGLSDPIEIQICAGNAEACAIAIMNFCDDCIGMDMADLCYALGSGIKTSFYHTIPIDVAKYYVAESSSVAGIAMKVYMAETTEETFGLDDVEKIADEMLDMCNEETYLIYNAEHRPELAECTCDLFITSN